MNHLRMLVVIIVVALATSNVMALTTKLATNSKPDLARVDCGDSFALLKESGNGQWKAYAKSQDTLTVMDHTSGSKTIPLDSLPADVKREFDSLKSASLDGPKMIGDSNKNLNVDQSGPNVAIRSIEINNFGAFIVTDGFICANSKPAADLSYTFLAALKDAVILSNDQCQIVAKRKDQLPTALQQYLERLSARQISGESSGSGSIHIGETSSGSIHIGNRPGQNSGGGSIHIGGTPGSGSIYIGNRPGQTPGDNSFFNINPAGQTSYYQSADVYPASTEFTDESGNTCVAVEYGRNQKIKCLEREMSFTNTGSNVQVCCHKEENQVAATRRASSVQGGNIQESNSDSNTFIECSPRLGGCQKTRGSSGGNRGSAGQQSSESSANLSLKNSGSNVEILSEYQNGSVQLRNSGSNVRFSSLQVGGTIDINNSGSNVRVSAEQSGTSTINVHNSGSNVKLYV